MTSVNRTFWLEGWLPFALFFGMIALGIVAALLLPDVLQFLEADRCSDAGGRFNYETGDCVKRKTT
jgi:hypothetical protein